MHVVRRIERMLRGCHEEVRRKLLPWNLAFKERLCRSESIYARNVPEL